MPTRVPNLIHAGKAAVLKRLQNVMVRSIHQVLKYARQHNANLRTASYMLAIDRVAAVHRMRGIYP